MWSLSQNLLRVSTDIGFELVLVYTFRGLLIARYEDAIDRRCSASLLQLSLSQRKVDGGAGPDFLGS